MGDRSRAGCCVLAGRCESSALDSLLGGVDRVDPVALLLEPVEAAFFATIALLTVIELFTGIDFFAAAIRGFAFFAAEVLSIDFETLVFDPAKFFLGVDFIAFELAAF